VAWRYVDAPAPAALPWRIAALWRHRRLLRRMAERDLRQRYVGSTLGFAWAVIHPLLFVAAYALIFTFLFRGRVSAGAPAAEYALYVIVGLLPWVALTDVAGRAAQAMSEHRSLVKHVVFPVQILPLTGLYATGLSQGVGLAAAIAFAAALRGGLDLGLLWLVPVVCLQIGFLAGVAWLLGAAGAVSRDVKEVVQLTLMVGMFLTPIFYLERDVPAALRVLIELNPLTHLVRLYRDAVLWGGLQHPGSLLVFAVFAAVVLVAGFLTFERVRVFLSDIL
jgi:lipopolysaccharide transport system permease protein